MTAEALAAKSGCSSTTWTARADTTRTCRRCTGRGRLRCARDFGASSSSSCARVQGLPMGSSVVRDAHELVDEDGW